MKNFGLTVLDYAQIAIVAAVGGAAFWLNLSVTYGPAL
jgi:hypothetical protein